MSVQVWTARERACAALSRASVQASRCCLLGDREGMQRWERAEANALAALERLEAAEGVLRPAVQLDAFPDALPMFPAEVRDAG